MSNQKFQNYYRIESSRARWHNYYGGIYFITICTQNRESYFGEIKEVNGEQKMILSEIGAFAQNNLELINHHNSYAEVPLFTIMPNHVHLIVIIDGDKIPHPKRTVETFQEETFQEETFQETSLQGNTTPIQRATIMQSWLSVVVRQFKQSVTRFAKQNHLQFEWQSRFHDHIVRDLKEMNLISDYIERKYNS